MTAAVVVCAHFRRNNPATCVLAPNHDGEHKDINGHGWFNYGPLQQYEITWMSGHVETVPAHQVSYPHQGMAMARSLISGLPADGGVPRVQLHAEIDGQWLLMLSAREEDIRTMRNVTGGEHL
jgi:hypothetical protein